MPWRADQRRLKYRYIGLYIMFVIALISSGFWGANCFLKNTITAIEQKTKSLENDIQRLKSQEAIVKEKVRQIEFIKSSNLIMKTIKLSNKKTYQKLTKLIAQVPGTIQLSALSLSDERWGLEGVATDKESLLSFSKKVRAWELLKNYGVKKWEVSDEGINFLFNEEN